MYIHPLTTKQNQCLELSLQGMRQVEIAKVLGISQKNVSKHIRNARVKIDGIKISSRHGRTHERSVDPTTLDELGPNEIRGVA